MSRRRSPPVRSILVDLATGTIVVVTPTVAARRIEDDSARLATRQDLLVAGRPDLIARLPSQP